MKNQVEKTNQENRQVSSAGDTSQIRLLNPRADICDADGKVLLRLEMPGVDKEHINIQVEGSQLKITGDMTAQPEPRGGKYILRERPHGRYVKAYTLDDTIDSQKIAAKMENGILGIELGLKEAVKPRKVEIKG